MTMRDDELVDVMARAIREEAGGDLELSIWTARDYATAALAAYRNATADDGK